MEIEEHIKLIDEQITMLVAFKNKLRPEPVPTSSSEECVGDADFLDILISRNPKYGDITPPIDREKYISQLSDEDRIELFQKIYQMAEDECGDSSYSDIERRADELFNEVDFRKLISH